MSFNKEDGEGPPTKKTKPQRSRTYRRKVMCKDCGAQMNADNFSKHNSSRHNGRAKSQDGVQASQTTLNFATVSVLMILTIC